MISSLHHLMLRLLSLMRSQSLVLPELDEAELLVPEEDVEVLEVELRPEVALHAVEEVVESSFIAPLVS
jgi:hypothetical protein